MPKAEKHIRQIIVIGYFCKVGPEDWGGGKVNLFCINFILFD